MQKVVFVGDAGVGKTRLLMRVRDDAKLLEKNSSPETLPTNLEPFDLGPMTVYDTPGSRDFDRLRPMLCEDAMLFVVCFSFVDRQSLESVESRWMPSIKKQWPDSRVILVGTKSDLWESSDLIPQGVVEDVTAGDHYPCSSVLGDGCDQVVAALMSQMQDTDRNEARSSASCKAM